MDHGLAGWVVWNVGSLSYDCLREVPWTMTDQQLLECISLDPKIMAGKPVVRGTRLAVDYILNLLAHGATVDEVLEEYQGLAPEDIQACILFAAKCLEDSEFMHLAEST